jgi:hypothetical protein
LHISEGVWLKVRECWGLDHIHQPRISEFADKKSANYEGRLYCFLWYAPSLIVYIMNWENFRECPICLSLFFPSPLPHFSAFQKFLSSKVRYDFFRSKQTLNWIRLDSARKHVDQWFSTGEFLPSVPPIVFGQNFNYLFGNRGDFCCNLQNKAFFSVFYTKVFRQFFF